MSTLIQVMQEIDQEFNIKNEKNFNDFLQEANEALRNGILSQDTHAILIKGLFLFEAHEVLGLQIIVAGNYDTFPDGSNSRLQISVESEKPCNPVLIISKDVAADPMQLAQAIQKSRNEIERRSICSMKFPHLQVKT